MKKLNWTIFAAVVWLLLAAAFIRVHGWEKYAFSPDDVMHLNIASQPGAVKIFVSSREQVHPPLLYLIYHVALKVSRNEAWLRSVSVATGLGVMLILFFTARRASGNAAALTALLAVGLSYGGVLISEVIRHYIFLLLFFSLGLWCFVAWHQDRRRSRLVGFSLAAFLAALSHYSAIFELAAVGLVWFGFLAARRNWRDCLRVTLAFVPAGLVLGMSFLAHIIGVFSSGRFGRAQEGYLKAHFATSPLQFLDNLRGLFGYLFLPPVAVPTMILTAAGVVALWRRGQRELAAVIALAFGLAIGANLAGKYPLGGTRHCIYLLPVAALAVAAAVQWIWEQAERMAWVRKRERLWSAALLTALVVSAWPLSKWLESHGYFRRYLGVSWTEFPLNRQAHDRAFAMLQRGFKPGDVAITNYQTSHYLIYESGNEPEKVGDDLRRINCRGIDYYYLKPIWTLVEEKQLTELFDALGKIGIGPVASGPGQTWFLNLGWGDGFPKELRAERLINGGGARLMLQRGSSVPPRP